MRALGSEYLRSCLFLKNHEYSELPNKLAEPNKQVGREDFVKCEHGGKFSYLSRKERKKGKGKRKKKSKKLSEY